MLMMLKMLMFLGKFWGYSGVTPQENFNILNIPLF